MMMSRNWCPMKLLKRLLKKNRNPKIRAHAKYLGIPLMGDEVYGGSKNMALSRLQLNNPSSLHGHLSQLVSKLDRPCLHALTLGNTTGSGYSQKGYQARPPTSCCLA